MPEYEIGSHSYVSNDFRILWPHEDWKVTIGRYTSIAARVTIILAGEHHAEWITQHPMGEREHRFGKGDVCIGNDVWIGHGATILSGVTIEDGATIGAMAVVASNVPAYAVVTGNPAEVRRYRFSVMVRTRLQQLAWWDWPAERVQSHKTLLLSPNVEAFLMEAEQA